MTTLSLPLLPPPSLSLFSLFSPTTKVRTVKVILLTCAMLMTHNNERYLVLAILMLTGSTSTTVGPLGGTKISTTAPGTRATLGLSAVQQRRRSTAR